MKRWIVATWKPDKESGANDWYVLMYWPGSRHHTCFSWTWPDHGESPTVMDKTTLDEFTVQSKGGLAFIREMISEEYVVSIRDELQMEELCNATLGKERWPAVKSWLHGDRREVEDG